MMLQRTRLALSGNQGYEIIRAIGHKTNEDACTRRRNLLGTSHSSFPKELTHLNLGGDYDMELCETMPFCVDWDLWCRLLQLGEPFHVCKKTPCRIPSEQWDQKALTLPNQFADNDFQVHKEYPGKKPCIHFTDADIFIGRIPAKQDALPSAVLLFTFASIQTAACE